METRLKANTHEEEEEETATEGILIQMEDNEASSQIEDTQNVETIQEAQTYNLLPLPQARSEVWNYFGFMVNSEGHIFDKTHVICRLCGLSFAYSGNTTNFYSHLRSIHSEVNLKRNSSHSTSKSMLASINNNSANSTQTTSNQSPINKGGNKRTLEADGDSSAYDEFQENHPTTASLPKMLKTEQKSLDDEYFIPKQMITDTLVNFIITDCRPADVLYGQGFQKLLNLLAPGYLLPKKSELLMELRRRYDQLQREKSIVDIHKIISG